MFAQTFAVAGEKQEKAADEATEVLLKRFSTNPDVERARAEFDRAQKVEGRFHKDFDGSISLSGRWALCPTQRAKALSPRFLPWSRRSQLHNFCRLGLDTTATAGEIIEYEYRRSEKMVGARDDCKELEKAELRQ
jgi:hypothetical protein